MGRGIAFSPCVTTTTTRPLRNGARPTRAATAAVPSTTHVLQRIWDELSAGAPLQEVEDRMMEVETELFSQASAWSKTFTPLRTVVAEVADANADADSMSVSILVLPRKCSTITAGIRVER